jgi:hypothetical protein
MGILFTMAMGFLLTVTMGKLFTMTLGIQLTISKAPLGEATFHLLTGPHSGGRSRMRQLMDVEIVANAYFNHTAIDGKLDRVLCFEGELIVFGLFVEEGVARVGQKHSFTSFRGRLRTYLGQRISVVYK